MSIIDSGRLTVAALPEASPARELLVRMLPQAGQQMIAEGMLLDHALLLCGLGEPQRIQQQLFDVFATQAVNATTARVFFQKFDQVKEDQNLSDVALNFVLRQSSGNQVGFPMPFSDKILLKKTYTLEGAHEDWLLVDKIVNVFLCEILGLPLVQGKISAGAFKVIKLTKERALIALIELYDFATAT